MRPSTPPLPPDEANAILRRVYTEVQQLHPELKASELLLAGVELEQRLERKAQAERDDYFMTQAAARQAVGTRVNGGSVSTWQRAGCCMFTCVWTVYADFEDVEVFMHRCVMSCL